jgi:hypothetical protein
VVIKLYSYKEDQQEQKDIDQIYQKEVQDNQMVANLPLYKPYYSIALSHFKSPPRGETKEGTVGRGFSCGLVYRRYPRSLADVVMESSETSVHRIERILCQVVNAHYLLAMSVPSKEGSYILIHNNLTYDNIYLTDDDQPVIGGFGQLAKLQQKGRQETCFMLIQEAIWLILQIRNYIYGPPAPYGQAGSAGSAGHAVRPWLRQLLRPAIIDNVREMDYFAINQSLISQMGDLSNYSQFYEYWLRSPSN